MKTLGLLVVVMFVASCGLKHKAVYYDAKKNITHTCDCPIGMLAVITYSKQCTCSVERNKDLMYMPYN